MPRPTWTRAKAMRVYKLCCELTALQRELFDLGLVQTAAKMSLVTQRIGWEIAERMKDAGMVPPLERRRRRLAEARADG